VIGIEFSSTFGSSPNSATAHRTYEFLLPLVVTTSNDPAYFNNPPSCSNSDGANPLSGYCNAFSKQSLGFPASLLGSGASVGVAPYAAPLCPGNTCPMTPPKTLFFGFCASSANVPTVATFVQIGTDGKTSLSTPISTQGIACPPQS
jgi:hypothetical protein